MLGYEDIEIEEELITKEFSKELQTLLYKAGLPKITDTPVYILANIMVEALCNYAEANKRRDKWLQKRMRAQQSKEEEEKAKLILSYLNQPPSTYYDNFP